MLIREPENLLGGVIWATSDESLFHNTVLYRMLSFWNLLSIKSEDRFFLLGKAQYSAYD